MLNCVKVGQSRLWKTKLNYFLFQIKLNLVILFQIQILFQYEYNSCVVIFLIIITFSPNYSLIYNYVIIILIRVIKMVTTKNHIWLHDYVWTLVARCHNHENQILALWCFIGLQPKQQTNVHHHWFFHYFQ
jgi:hypothetical protein